jgi:hypothetical protein
VATIPLKHSSLIVTAVEDGELVGVARAMFDGLDASIHELSLDLRLQGHTRENGNGSLIAADPFGVVHRLAWALLQHLFGQGCYFVTVDIVEGVEQLFYEGLGLVRTLTTRVPKPPKYVCDPDRHHDEPRSRGVIDYRPSCDEHHSGQ